MREPLSLAVSPPSAVAVAAGLGCAWQAVAGVVAGLATTTVLEAPAAMLPSEQLRTFATMLQVEGVTEVQVNPPLLGSVSVSITFVAVALPGLLTTMVKLTCAPWTKLPLSGVFTTFSCGAAGGVQVMEPESRAVRPLSAVAMAAGFGCGWHAASGVVAGLDTVTVTDPPAGMVPSMQFSTLPLNEQLAGVTDVQVRPPLIGRVSVSLTLVAGAVPGLLTTMVKRTCPPWTKLPLSGVLTTLS